MEEVGDLSVFAQYNNFNSPSLAVNKKSLSPLKSKKKHSHEIYRSSTFLDRSSDDDTDGSAALNVRQQHGKISPTEKDSKSSSKCNPSEQVSTVGATVEDCLRHADEIRRDFDGRSPSTHLRKRSLKSYQKSMG